ncbi:MAG: hypothetical protein IKP04_01585 [Candidatus Methanomethylophilaceae archaeon]|nr:hypothetical protein [Candidatus Methanomethylophilaceae archaeon]
MGEKRGWKVVRKGGINHPRSPTSAIFVYGYIDGWMYNPITTLQVYKTILAIKKIMYKSE